MKRRGLARQLSGDHWLQKYEFSCVTNGFAQTDPIVA
jgi:hypothetical protein